MSIKSRGGLLSSALRASAVVAVLGVSLAAPCFIGLETWRNTIRPEGIIIHHTALPVPCNTFDAYPIDAQLIDSIHAARGFKVRYWGRTYSIGYHYLILANGTVQPGRPEMSMGAHTLSHNNTVGISLVGDFGGPPCTVSRIQPSVVTEPQMKALVELCRRIMRRHSLPVTSVRLHRDYNSETECPGERFPREELSFALGMRHFDK